MDMDNVKCTYTYYVILPSSVSLGIFVFFLISFVNPWHPYILNVCKSRTVRVVYLVHVRAKH